MQLDEWNIRKKIAQVESIQFSVLKAEDAEKMRFQIDTDQIYDHRDMSGKIPMSRGPLDLRLVSNHNHLILE